MKGEKTWDKEDRVVTRDQVLVPMARPEVRVALWREKLRFTPLPAKLGEEDTQGGVLTSQRSQPGSEGSGGSWRSQELKNNHPGEEQ